MRRLFFSFVLLLSLTAADWRQWRGFSRNGLASHKVDFDKLPAGLKEEWAVEVGTGYASPLISGSKVFVFARKQGREVVLALDRATGKPVWDASYPAPFKKNSYASEITDGPFATPLLYNNTQLVTWGVSGVLSCWNAATGALQWRNDYSAQSKTDKFFAGFAASPLGNNGRIYLHTGDDRGGRFLALDAATGRKVWDVDLGAGPGYASPILHEVRGTPMIVTLTNSTVVGLAEKDGQRLWSYPFPDQWLENIVTPLAFQNGVLVSGVRNGTALLQLTADEAGQWSVERRWHNPEVTMYMTSPVLDGETVYAYSSRKKGQFVAFNANTGKLLWETEGRDAVSPSLILADNALLAATQDGELIVVKKDREKFQLARKYKLAAGPVHAHAALADGELYLKDDTHLRKFRGL